MSAISKHPRQRGILYVGANGGSPAALLTELTHAFATFKASNQGKLDQLNTAVNDMAQQIAASMVGAAGGISHDPDNHPSAARQQMEVMAAFARTGRIENSMSTDSDPDGGFLVDRVLSNKISRRIFDMSPMGRLARHETITVGDSFAEPIDVEDIGAEWVGEHEERDVTQTGKLRMLTTPVHEIYTNQPVTQRLLDDSSYDVGAWLYEKIIDKFARSEGKAYIAGNGVKRPRGILTYDTSLLADGNRPWGVIQHVNTGAAGAFASSDPADALINLVYSLRAPYRPNARWLMNLATAGMVRKLKDAEGRYIWGEALIAGQPPTLLGFPVEIDEEMPAIGANSLSIAFGDFSQAYIIVDRPGIRLLRDPYSAKPYVLFYSYRRVGGQVQNSEAYKLLRFAAHP